MTIENLNDISALFGAPLSVVPEPKKPFKIKGWHVVVVLIGGTLMVCGVLYIRDKFRKQNFTNGRKKTRQEREQEWRAKFKKQAA